MNWDDMNKAMGDAKAAFKRADNVANEMARLMVGRLRKCNPSTLRRLKRELRDFNMTTGEWR
jgi:hypothetical protein